MLAVVSPAKNLDYDSDLPKLDVTQPRMLDQAEALVKVCRKLSNGRSRKKMLVLQCTHLTAMYTPA